MHKVCLCGTVCADMPDTVSSMKLEVNQLDEQQHAVPTGSIETMECGLVLRSIGYRSTQADPDVPFDVGRGHVPNTSGVVQPGEWMS
jgi:adrenodoxin-NADP+ reductase